MKLEKNDILIAPGHAFGIAFEKMPGMKAGKLFEIVNEMRLIVIAALLSQGRQREEVCIVLLGGLLKPADTAEEPGRKAGQRLEPAFKLS